MTTSLIGLPMSAALPVSLKKKRVLLVDASAAKRDLRAEAMRRLGVEVDTASDISEARSWWRADLYNLVLINLENELGNRDRFCEDVRAATPPQQLAFLVGKPEYLADVPNADLVAADPVNGTLLDIVASGDTITGVSQRWGIMEASKRISAVRTVSAARTTALRNRPTPPRDLEVRYSRREAAAQRLDPQGLGSSKSDSQKEEVI